MAPGGFWIDIDGGVFSRRKLGLGQSPERRQPLLSLKHGVDASKIKNVW